MLATELSGFAVRNDMSDSLVIAISQSGTTTDTNRTVDLIRGRGASVVSIVNRRNSDLTDKSDGVLYTSDGRDVEMSVASTKAFYAQVAAGFLLAFAIADEVTGELSEDRETMLHALRDLPAAMEQVLARRTPIGEVAHRLAPARRYWAVVGNGSNRIAAHEVRIKLSELCYKSIACDGTEDKKHIDLSA
jgi:glucosamine--fructose-6-phosphate aminotransferase (isomerizing)